MKKILLSFLALLTASCNTPGKLTVCMIYTDIGKMRCSMGGEQAFDVEYTQANQFVCMPKDDASVVFNRIKQCGSD